MHFRPRGAQEKNSEKTINCIPSDDFVGRNKFNNSCWKRYVQTFIHQFHFHDYKNVCFSPCCSLLKKNISNAINYSAIYLSDIIPKRQIVLIATKMNRRWICNDVWMDILPCFDHDQLGLKLALLSPRFNALVDKHFDGKSELTIWRQIAICKRIIETKPKLTVLFDDKIVEFPLPDDRPLPSKIRFKFFLIDYIDHSVIAFLRLNHQFWDRRGTDLHLLIPSSPHTTDDRQPIWDVFVYEIWPIFSTNIHHLGFSRRDHLDNLRLRTSSTILTDLNQLVSIDSHDLLPESFGVDFDVPNGTISAGQALSKWLHSPRKDGQPKRLGCEDYNEQTDIDWVNNFKEHFLRANAISSVNYEIHFTVYAPSMQMVPFELVNEWTKEKLTLAKENENDLKNWIMKRCKIIGETAAVQQQKKDENYNNVFFCLFSGTNCIGPLSPPPEEVEEEEAGQSITKGASSADK